MRGWLITGLLLTMLPALVSGQEDCVSQGSGLVTVTNQDQPNQVAIIERANLVCPGGKRLQADQAISSQASGQIQLIGNVRYRDPERSLTSQRADYYKRDALVHATGNVVLRDLRTGSTLHGQDIRYHQVSATRREALLQAFPSTNRPRAVLRDLQRASSGRDSSTVVADMIEVHGENLFRGLGSAIVTRDSLTGYGGIAEYDQATGRMNLLGQGRVVGPQYQLRGDTVRALIQQDTLREVNSQGNANLTATAGDVEAPRIWIELIAGKVARMVAARTRDTARTAPVLPQPRVVAEEFRLSADSIDVRAPGQVLEEVIAIGDAFSATNDTIPAPPEVGNLEGTLNTDWMRGDTVHAFFIENPRAATDTSANDRALDRVVSTGDPASTLYRKRELQPPAAAPTAAADTTQAAPAPPAPSYEIGYLLARRIEVKMVDGEVQDVTASEDVRGVYLQPRAGASAQAVRPTRQQP